MASSKTNRRWKRWLGRAGNWVLDPSVVFSFDQNGFRRHALFFDDPELKIDMSGKVCVVTGANSHWVRHIPWPRQTRCGRLDVV